MQLCVDRGADFNEDRTRRYRLWRLTGLRGQVVLFVMLNPSDADETEDDPTLRRCIGFAERWRCSRIEVVNAFTAVTSAPSELKRLVTTADSEDDEYLRRGLSACDFVVAAWGRNGTYLGRDKQVRGLLRESGKPVYCFGVTKNGQPEHPLYIPYARALVPFIGAGSNR